MPKQQHTATDGFLTSAQVRARYGGVSDMWLWRRLEDDPDFPKPAMRVKGKRFWKLASLRQWEEQQNAST